ncbi:Mis12-Mtw1 protein family-domain-containing protein [Amanita rubescens]|nr:Mis12-Mtw1 protein family-domain-containing protein [Amanita rubescens]
MLTISSHLSSFSASLTTSIHCSSHASTTCMQKQEQAQSKRKTAPEMEDNPLLNASKRTKKDVRLANAEPTRSGLFIVRESSVSQAESNSREGSTALQPSSSLPLKRNASSDLRAPPSKKARAESQPPMPATSSKSSATRPAPAEQPRPPPQRSGSLPPANGRPTARHGTGFEPITEEDERIEDDIRAMDAEADHLRRSSRVHLPDSSSNMLTSITFNPGQDKPRARSRSRSRIISKDSVRTIPFDDHRGREREREPNAVNGNHRRRSSISGRGKRISTSFEVGVIPQPHNSVSSTSFYKHIDADLPDSERLRTLLIWCASRAAAKSTSPSKPNSTASDNGKESSGDKDNRPPEPELPPLSARAQEVLKNIQEDVIRMLAERKKQLKPNEQNIRYAEHIKRAQEEEETWKRVSYHYDAYIKRQKEFLAKRMARMTPSPTSAATYSQPTTPSAKAKGKQRDMGMDDPFKAINVHDLPPDMQRGISIAKALIASSPPPQKRLKRNSSTPLPMPTLPDGELDLIGQALDEEIERRMHHVEFKLDYLLSCAHAARAMVKTAEELLNRWFEILDQNLASRVNIQLGAPSTSSSSSSSTSGAGSAPSSSNLSDPSSLGGFLTKYVPRRLPPAGFAISGYEEEEDTPSSSSASHIPPPPPPPTLGMDPRDLLRALSLVDRTRPPAMVGDAARRAAREVARAGETGIGVVGERPIQKVPTTPRRADRTIRRDRTPAR